MVNIDRIIRENINKFVNNIIKESEFDYVVNHNSNPLDELINKLKDGVILKPDNGELEIETPSYMFYIDYELDTNLSYKSYPGDYLTPPETEIFGEDDWTVSYLKVECFDHDGEEIQVETPQELYSLIEKVGELDLDGYEMEEYGRGNGYDYYYGRRD